MTIEFMSVKWYYFAMKIREATAEDYEGIKAVQKATWLATYPNEEYGISLKEVEAQVNRPPRRPIEEARKAIAGDENGHYWVATENDEIVGFCSALRKDGKNRVGAIYIFPDYQGKGIGKQLMVEAFRWLGNDKDIFVGVASYNEQAIKFYESFGFVSTGETGTSPGAKLPFGSVIPEIEMVRKEKQ